MNITHTTGQMKVLQDVTDLYDYARNSEMRRKYLLQLDQSYKFYYGDQWSEELKSTLDGIGATPFTFNRIEPLINTYTSLQIASRRRASFKSTTGIPQHAILAENVNNLIYNIQNQNDYQNETTLKFIDALVGGIGWSNFGYDSYTKSFFYERCDPREMFWDPDDQSQRMVNSNFRGRSFYVSIVYLKERYPKYASYFESLIGNTYKGDDSYQWYVAADDEGNTWTKGRSIKIVEIYYKKNVKYYEAITSFDSDQPIDEDGVTSLEQYFCTFNKELAESKKVKGTEVETKEGTQIWKAVFCADVLLESGKLESQVPNQKNFPFEPLCLKRTHQGAPYGIVEGLIPLQNALNFVWTKTMHGLNSKYIILDDSTADPTKYLEYVKKQLQQKIGLITTKNPQNAQFINGENLLSQLFAAKAALDLEFEQRTQLYDEIRGNESNAISGTAIKQRTVNNARSQNPLISQYEYMLTSEAQLMLDTIRGIDNLKYAFNYYKDGKVNYATLDQELSIINFEIFPDIAPNFSTVNEEQQSKFSEIIDSPNAALRFSDPTFLEASGISKEKANEYHQAYVRATQPQQQPEEGQTAKQIQQPAA